MFCFFHYMKLGYDIMFLWCSIRIEEEKKRSRDEQTIFMTHIFQLIHISLLEVERHARIYASRVHIL